ncbi:hypothetical protein B0H11DRAFT_1711589 [Mycena galericulata]|nr:hypothetical protein B0H11DRAFT_1711589 [Mycena galericulata]
MSRSKKWNWSGRVTISPVDHANTETICQKATLTDSTEPAEPSKPKLASFVLSTKDLNLPRFYDVEDVVILLPTCKPAQQFARLVAEGADKESLHALVEYMDRKGQVAVLPALFDDDDIGHLLFVPPSAKALLTALCVPPELSSPGPSLIAALLFLLSPAGLPYRHPFRYRPHVTVGREILSPEQWRLSVRTEHAYHLALRITGLSASARCFAYAHPSVVWAGPATNPINEADTGHLRRALSKCRKGIIDAAHVGQANDVGTVFIHVGALRTVHALPNLVALRQRPDVHFYSYGTDPAVPPARWRVREIFPLGGVVTFTPVALAGDPWGVLHTIQHIHAHPLWVCYLLPQVVGLAVRLIQASQDDVMQEYTEGMPLAMDRILDALLDGQVALLSAREARHAQEVQWALEYVWLRPMNKAALLACCEAACDVTLPYAPTSPAAAAAAKNVIIADMYRMQAQPALMDSYRRFIALDLDAATRTGEDADGIEWGTVKTFDFNDDFLKARGS